MSRPRENPRKIFSLVFPRSTHQDASIELSFVSFCSVGASEEKLASNKKRVCVKLSKTFYDCTGSIQAVLVSSDDKSDVKISSIFIHTSSLGTKTPDQSRKTLYRRYLDLKKSLNF